jgi:hypothetical protein
MGWASCATLVLATAATGHVVARETGRSAWGLAALAAVGLTSVLGPALLWYSSSQAVGAGTCILIMLVSLQAWRVRGAWWRLAAGLLAASVAPLFWTAGYAAGPAGIAYLWADGRRACRRAAAFLAISPLAVAALAWCLAGRGFGPASHFAARSLRDALPIEAIAAHSAQAVCEALVLNNLGLDAPTMPAQALVFCGVVAGLWFWSRRRTGPDGSPRWPRINPLEAAGAVLVVATFGMIFAGRGTETGFENLRALGVYDVIPEIGAVLFVAGWCAGERPSPPPATLEPPGPAGLLGVVLFAAVALALQMPRVERVIFEYDRLAAPVWPPPAEGSARRTPAELMAQAEAQRQALAALDRMEGAARLGKISRAAIARMPVPGMPTNLVGFDASALLELPGNSEPLREPGDVRR